MFVKGDYNVEVDGNKNEYIYGNLNQVVHGARSVTIDEASTESIGSTQTIKVSGSQNITASVTNINNDVNVTGTVKATTEVQASNIKLTTHKHSGVQSGPSTTGAPTP